MLKYRIILLITTACCTNYSIAQNRSIPDSLCSLTLVGNKAFTAFANARTKTDVNRLHKTAKKEILYLQYIKQTGNYSGASLQLNNAGKVVKCYRFAYNNKKGFTYAVQKWTGDNLNLKNLFTDSACYMNNYYRSGGTDELLLCRKYGVPVNGLIYKGCALNDTAKEIAVNNKTYLQLLNRFRKNF